MEVKVQPEDAYGTFVHHAKAGREGGLQKGTFSHKQYMQKRFMFYSRRSALYFLWLNAVAKHLTCACQILLHQLARGGKERAHAKKGVARCVLS